MVARETSLWAQRLTIGPAKLFSGALYFFQYGWSLQKRKHIMCLWLVGSRGLDTAWDAARAEVQSEWAKAELNGPTVQQLAWVS